MDTFASLTDIWKHFDDAEKKHFLAEDVSAAINSLPADTSNTNLCVYEAMAFGFSENNDGNEWGTYYGPRFTYKRKDSGEDVYSPDIKDITEDMMDHWNKGVQKLKTLYLK